MFDHSDTISEIYIRRIKCKKTIPELFKDYNNNKEQYLKCSTDIRNRKYYTFEQYLMIFEATGNQIVKIS